MQIKSTQAETKFKAPQHLVTNLAHKLNPMKKNTQYLRARIDTCAEANIIPLSVYKLILGILIVKSLHPAPKLQLELTPLTRSI